MTTRRTGFARLDAGLPSEGEQRAVLALHGVGDALTGTGSGADLLEAAPELRALARDGGWEIAVSEPRVLADTGHGARLVLAELQRLGIRVFDCESGHAVLSFHDVERFVERADAARAAHGRGLGGARRGPPEKPMLVSRERALAWWHDEELSKKWVSDHTGVSERTLFARLGPRRPAGEAA